MKKKSKEANICFLSSKKFIFEIGLRKQETIFYVDSERSAKQTKIVWVLTPEEVEVHKH